MDNPRIELADERVSWKVPTLFGNDRVALSLAQTLNPLLPKPLFATAYGCPACAWAGGRNPRVRGELSEEELRRYFEAYRKVGATCALTFSRPDAGDYVDDAYSNMLLSLADEYGGQAIVVDERLAHHIRATHPDVSLVASYNRCILDHAQGFGGLSEESYYRKLLELYDEVVVRCEAMLEGDIAQSLTDIAPRIQVIVNQRCVPNCPDGARHIAASARSIQREAQSGERVLASCTQPNRAVMGSVYISPERRKELADMGFVIFKLQGRIAPATSAFKILMRNILKDGMDLTSTEVLLPLVEQTLLLDGCGTNFDEMIRIPPALAGE
ncbi:MAG: hypothetical protein Q4C09_10645 [Atopobiaceae bacterium]|nr:hypothetical protein [Atopobiaceae bacterium]